jgi:hydrogenase 3 maturation protease
MWRTAVRRTSPPSKPAKRRGKPLSSTIGPGSSDRPAPDETLDTCRLVLGAAARVAVLGVGNEVLGDDGIGVAIARELAPRVRGRQDCLVLETGTAPENFTAPVRRFRPDFVLLVDAAQLSAEAGAIAWLDWRQTDGLSASTHTLPASVVAQFLVEDLGCGVALLVIQPAQLEYGQPLSAAVRQAGDRVVDCLADVLMSRPAV